MRRLTPFSFLLLLGALSSLVAVGRTWVLTPHARAAEPALQQSAEIVATPGPSYAVPTSVTEVTPPTAVPEPPAPASPALDPVTPPAPVEPPAPAQVPSIGSSITTAEPVSSPEKSDALLRLMNDARRAQGAAALEPDEELDDIALVRARSLAAIGYFDHYAPDGTSAFSELAVRGRRYRLAGENLARNNYPEARTVRAAFDGLMASPGHRANILEQRFARVGVAAALSGRVWIYVTVFTD